MILDDRELADAQPQFWRQVEESERRCLEDLLEAFVEGGEVFVHGVAAARVRTFINPRRRADYLVERMSVTTRITFCAEGQCGDNSHAAKFTCDATRESQCLDLEGALLLIGLTCDQTSALRAAVCAALFTELLTVIPCASAWHPFSC